MSVIFVPAVKAVAPALTATSEPTSAQLIAPAPQVDAQHQPTKRTRTLETRSRHGGARPRPPLIDLHQPGHLSVGNVMALLSIRSSSTLYAWLADGRIPPPDGRNPRPYWRTETISAYLARGAS